LFPFAETVCVAALASRGNAVAATPAVVVAMKVRRFMAPSLGQGFAVHARGVSCDG